MRVHEQAARKMCAAMGWKMALEWPEKKLIAALTDLAERAVSAEELPDGKDKILRDRIIKARQEGETIELEESEGDVKTEKAGKKESKPTKAASGNGKAKKKTETSAPQARPGVTAAIIEMLQKANADNPVSKDGMLNRLVKQFPEKKPESLKNTLNASLYTLPRDGRIKIVKAKDDAGYFAKV